MTLDMPGSAPMPITAVTPAARKRSCHRLLFDGVIRPAPEVTYRYTGMQGRLEDPHLVAGEGRHRVDADVRALDSGVKRIVIGHVELERAETLVAPELRSERRHPLDRGVGHRDCADGNDRAVRQEVANDALTHHAGAAENRDFHEALSPRVRAGRWAAGHVNPYRTPTASGANFPALRSSCIAVRSLSLKARGLGQKACSA